MTFLRISEFLSQMDMLNLNKAPSAFEVLILEAWWDLCWRNQWTVDLMQQVDRMQQWLQLSFFRQYWWVQKYFHSPNLHYFFFLRFINCDDFHDSKILCQSFFHISSGFFLGSVLLLSYRHFDACCQHKIYLQLTRVATYGTHKIMSSSTVMPRAAFCSWE